MKKLNVIKQNEFFFTFEVFCENHLPTRHTQYKVIHFAPSNRSIMTNKLPLTIWNNF